MSNRETTTGTARRAVEADALERGGGAAAFNPPLKRLGGMEEGDLLGGIAPAGRTQDDAGAVGNATFRDSINIITNNMKTLTLEEALKRQPGQRINPFIAHIGTASFARLGIGMATVATMHESEHGDTAERAALLAHFYNHGPELVRMIDALLQCCELNMDDMEDDTRKTVEHAQDLLSKASTVQMP